MSDHLLRRGGVYYYHRRVPKAAVEAVGKKIVTYSLRTGDRKAAKKLAAVEDVRWNARFEGEERRAEVPEPQKSKPASAGLIQLVREYVENADERSRTLLLADPPVDMAEKADMTQDAEITRSILKNLDDPRGHQWVHSVTTGLALSSDPPSCAERVLAEIVRRGLLELQNRKVARLNDDFSRPFFDPTFGPQSQVLEPTFGQVAEQLLALTDAEAKANGTSQKWVDKQRSNVAVLKEIVGEAIPIIEVDFDACMRVRTVLASIPANRNKVYGTLPLDAAIERARLEGKPLLSSVTQEQYLATFRSILGLAAKKRLIGVNPAADLKPLKRDAIAAADKRLPLTPRQLKGFFEGNFYRTCAEKACPPYSYDRTGWRFWMPLITLYMGMRPQEVCQLSASDVKCTEEGTPYIDVVATDDEGEPGKHRKKLKTTTSRRRVPVHPELVAIGFLEFAAARQSFGPEARLFPHLQPDRYGDHAKYALRRFREAFIPEEVELDERQSFYSLRHNFRDALRRASAPPDALQALGGWSQGRLVSDRYGDMENPDYQIRFMELVSYPDLDLAFLHACAISQTFERATR